jgi:hypothetical protein
VKAKVDSLTSRIHANQKWLDAMVGTIHKIIIAKSDTSLGKTEAWLREIKAARQEVEVVVE